MAIGSAYDRTRFLAEILDPLDTQEGVLSPLTQRTKFLTNLSGVAMTAAQLAAVAGVTLGTGAASKVMSLDANGDFAMPSGGVFALGRATLAAAGTTSANAAVLTQQINIVTGADLAKGVALPAAAAAEGPYIIINDAAASLLVYPVDGGNDNINALAEDAPFWLEGGATAMFVPVSATLWYVETLASRLGPRPITRSTIANAGTLTGAQHRGGAIFQDASGGNVTMTTLTGTLLAAAMPWLRVGDSVPLYHSANHASNTSTLAGGTDVTLVGSGAVINTGGQYLCIKTAATTFDLVRVG